MRAGAALCIVVAACVATACGGDDATSPDAAPPGADGARADAAQVDLFVADHVLDVDITLAAADWDALRAQTRSVFDVLGQSCLSAPPPSPFSYFPASVTIDGVTLPEVGLRKKGFFGSLSNTKPSLKINFDEVVAGQEYGGLDKLTLNNAKSDPSIVKQCLGYGLFAEAGLPSPRCGFAHVTVNGEDLGVFVNVESVDKHFLRRHYGDDDGNLYEGALSDFRPGWVETFSKKTNDADPSRDELRALTAALEGPDDGLVAALEPLVDLDRFVTFWAMELLLVHADGYARNTNNFFAYADPGTGKIQFIPWGIDSILFPDTTLPWEATRPPDDVWAEGALAYRLYGHAPTREEFRDRVRGLLVTVWDEVAIGAEIDRMAALIGPYVLPDEAAAHATALADLHTFVAGRRATLDAAFGGAPSAWTAPLRDPWCIDERGAVSGTFATTFGTHDSADPFGDGDSLVDLTMPSGTFSDLAGGATAGTTAEGKTAIRAVVLTSETAAVVVHIEADPSLIAPGADLDLDWIEASGYVIRIDFAPEPDTFEVIGVLGDGALHVDATGTRPGDPVTGAFTSTVYEPFF